MSNDKLAEALVRVLESPNEPDSNFEAANVVDALKHLARSMAKLADALKSRDSEDGIVEAGFDISRSIRDAARDLGNGGAATPMGALEAHGKAMLEAAAGIAVALSDVAEAIREKNEAK